MTRRALAFLVVAALLQPAAALAQSKSECFAAADAAQTLRDAGKLAAAREQFLVCSQAGCPVVVRQDCSGWLDQLVQNWPTVVVRAETNRGDVADVRVAVDGQVVSTRADGRPILVEPGSHVLRFETPGFPPVAQTIVVAAGEKNRVLQVHFEAPRPAPVAPPARSPSPERTSSTPYVIAGILGGVAAIGLVTDAIVGGSAYGSYSNLKSTCAPAHACSSSQVRSVDTRFIVGDVALGVGILSAAAAVVILLVTRRSAPPPPTAMLK